MAEQFLSLFVVGALLGACLGRSMAIRLIEYMCFFCVLGDPSYRIHVFFCVVGGPSYRIHVFFSVLGTKVPLTKVSQEAWD